MGDSHSLRGRTLRAGLMPATLAAIAALVFLPLGVVFFSGLGGLTSSPLSTLSDVCSRPLYRDIFFFTVKQAVASVAVTLALGMPGAYLFSRYSFRGRDQLMALSTLPFVMPSVLVVLGFVICFGNTGLLNSALSALFGIEGVPVRILYSWRAIVLAHAFYNVPLVYRFVSASWSHIDEGMVEAARSVGASGRRVFLDIELPFLRHAVISSAMLTFLYSFTSFAIILALGGPQYATVEVTIYTLSSMAGSYAVSSALAIVQLAFLSLVVLCYVRIPSPRGGRGTRAAIPFGSLQPVRRAVCYGYGAFMALFLFGPLLGIAYASVRQTAGGVVSLTLRWFSELVHPPAIGLLGTTPLGAVATSVGIAILATAVSVGAGTALSYLMRSSRHARPLLGVLTTAPLCVSTVTLALGYLVLGRELSFDLSLAGLVIIHALISLPFSVRAVSGALARLEGTLVEAALGVGASRLRAFVDIDLPLIRGGLLVAAVFSFALSLGELAAASLLSGGRYVTIPLYIYRYIGAYRIGPAAAMGVVLMAVSAAGFLVIQRSGALFRG